MAKVMLQDKVKPACQNISLHGPGAYTGEISAEQLVDFGLEWTLVGHSERRTLFKELYPEVAKKVANAQEQGLNVILCIGECIEQREAGTTNDTLKEQLDTAKDSVKDWAKIVVAYEPIWAIGTGKVASPEQAQETHEFIRSWFTENVSEEVANSIRIIYGGSVNEKNSQELIGQKDLDGFLVGGASLKPAFKTIVETVNAHHGSETTA
jgi:triosephosphate isomerase